MKKSEMTGEMFIQRRGFKGLDLWNDWHTYSDIRYKDDLTSELASWDVMSIYKINKEGNYIKIWERKETLSREEFERAYREYIEEMDFKPDWNDIYQERWAMEYDWGDKKMYFRSHQYCQKIGVDYFQSEAKIEECYNRFRKEIHKYWVRIEE